MQNYLNILQSLVDKSFSGTIQKDRTGTGTISKFGAQLRFDLLKSKLPIITTKKIHLKSIVHELIWFLKGSTNIGYLKDNNVKIWDEWATDEGDLGPVYGAMWRSWPHFVNNMDKVDDLCYNVYHKETIDQIQTVIDSIRMNPTSRRHIVSAWNPSLLPDTSLSPKENAKLGLQALPPCHTLFQFYCEKIPEYERFEILQRLQQINNDNNIKPSPIYSLPEVYDKLCDESKYNIPKYYLDCQLYQRSADWFLGVPFNITSYALLTHIIGKLTNTYPREFIHTFGDYHLYSNHIEHAKEQLSRTPLEQTSVVDLSNIIDLDSLLFDQIIIYGYESCPAIKAPISV